MLRSRRVLKINLIVSFFKFFTAVAPLPILTVGTMSRFLALNWIDIVQGYDLTIYN